MNRLTGALVVTTSILSACTAPAVKGQTRSRPSSAVTLPTSPSPSFDAAAARRFARDDGELLTHWDIPFGTRATIPDIATALTTAPGLSYRPFAPALGRPPIVVQRADDWLVTVYRFPPGGTFREDGRITVTQSKAQGSPLHMGESLPGGAPEGNLVAETVTVSRRPARLLVNTRTDVGRIIFEVDKVRVDITGPDAPPAAVLGIAQRVLASPRLGPIAVGATCPPIPTSAYPPEGPVGLVALQVHPRNELRMRRGDRWAVYPEASAEKLVAVADDSRLLEREFSGPQVAGYATQFRGLESGKTTIRARDSKGVVYRVRVWVVC